MVQVPVGWRGQLEGAKDGGVPHYQCSRSHEYSLRSGGQRGWRCRAQPVADTLSEGATVEVFMIRSACSSQILLMNEVSIPEPVPLPARGSAGSHAGSHRSWPPLPPRPGLDQLSPLCIVALSLAACPRLTKNSHLARRSSQKDLGEPSLWSQVLDLQDSTRNIVIHGGAIQMQVTVPVVGAGRLDAMFTTS